MVGRRACLTAASAAAAFGLSGSAQAAADETGKPRPAAKAMADPAFVYTDPASGAVVVESNAPSRVVDSMTAARGATSLSGVAVRTRSAGITDACHRRDDIPSFWGGAGISAGGGTSPHVRQPAQGHGADERFVVRRARLRRRRLQHDQQPGGRRWRRVRGYANYCHSGRTTGEHCGHAATSATATVCTSSGCRTNVIRFTGGVMIQPGDSGGAL